VRVPHQTPQKKFKFLPVIKYNAVFLLAARGRSGVLPVSAFSLEKHKIVFPKKRHEGRRSDTPRRFFEYFGPSRSVEKSRFLLRTRGGDFLFSSGTHEGESYPMKEYRYNFTASSIDNYTDSMMGSEEIDY